MDNQHRAIHGYRELDEDEISLINRIKQEGELLGEMIYDLRTMDIPDQRWVSLAETHLQQGIMAAVRAVAKPETF